MVSKTKSFDIKKALYLGSGLFAAQFLWTLYNNYMPIFLQAGNSAFQNNTSALGFGLSAGMAGFIMTLDNIAGFFLQPIMGPLSDRTRTRFGRRMPFILILGPISAIAFALIPLGPNMITQAVNGNVSALIFPFILTMIFAIVMLLSMALWRTPLFALMPDIFPSVLRSKANAVINLMAGIGSIIALVLGGMLFKISLIFPFILGGVITILAVVLLFIKIKEPKEYIESAESEGGFSVLKEIQKIPKDSIFSLVFLLLCVFFYLFGYNAIETFFSSFIATKFNLSAGQAGNILALVALSFLVFAFPSAMLASKFGRKKTMLLGLVVFCISLVAIYCSNNLLVIECILPVCGFAWALVNINGLPMVLDSSTDEKMMGTYSGFYFIAATLGGVLGPFLNGLFIELNSNNYNTIFIVCPVCFFLSFLFLLCVKKGEVQK